MTMEVASTVLRLRLSAEGQVVHADAPLLALQQEAGGDMGTALAIPQLAAIARLAQRLGVAISRPVVTATERGDIDMWVRARPEEGGVALSVIDWHERPPATMPADPVSRESDLAATSGGWRWQVDADLRFRPLSPDEAGEGPGLADRPVAGTPFTAFFTLAPDDRGDMPMMRALARHGAFRDQPATLTADRMRRLILSGVPVFALGGQLDGFRGTAMAVDEDAPQVAPQDMVTLYPAEFGRRLDRSLRQPLGRIIANADTISAQTSGDLRPDYAGYARDIATAGRHLMALVDDLADLQAIDRPDFAVTLEDIDLADLGRRAAGLLGVKALDRSIHVLAPDDGRAVPAIGEFRRVLQILVNLIGNAIRYAPEGSRVRVLAETRDTAARILVMDEGAGIPAIDRERVFEKFERLGRDDAAGSGLGLYISRRLARAMGGDIVIGDAPEGGACFTLTLPAAPEPGQP